MQVRDIVKLALKETKTTQAVLAGIMGAKGHSTIGMQINRNTMRTQMFVKIMDKLGYEVIVRPKKAGRKAEGEILVTYDELDTE